MISALPRFAAAPSKAEQHPQELVLTIGKRPRRKWTLVIVSTAAALILVEVGLQAAALVVWLLHAPGAVAAGGVDVLCVGDSFTEGWGASTLAQTYPAQLEVLLRQRGSPAAKVLQLGRGGQNSRDVLSRLTAQLEQYHPRVVCVLVGANDGWSRPPLLDEPAPANSTSDSAWRWRWRLPRLLAMAFTSRESGWQREVATGGENPTPASTSPASSDAAGAAKPPMTPAEQAAALLGQAWAIQAADPAQAVSLFQQAMLLGPDLEPSSRAGLTNALVHCGRIEETGEHVAWLRNHWQEHPSQSHGDSYVSALSYTGKGDEVLTEGAAVLAQFPDAVAVLFAVGLEHCRRSNNTETVRYMTAGAARCGEGAWAAEMLRVSADANFALGSATSRRQGIEQLVEALARDGNKAKCAVVLSKVKPPIEAAEYSPVLAATAAPEPRGMATNLFELRANDEAWLTVFERHLEHMANVIHAHGATTVLVTYPFSSVTAEVQERVASRLHIELVQVAPRFADELKTRDRLELFIADGHCTDAGYGIVAAEVARVVARHLR